MSLFEEFSKPINSADDADLQIKSACKGLWILVALQSVLLGVLGAISNPVLAMNSALDVIALAACAWFLPRSHSRALAVFLVLLAIGALGASVLAKIGLVEGGKNVFLVLVLFGASLQIARSIFAWHKFRPHTTIVRNVVITSVLASIYAFLAFLLSAVALALTFSLSDEALGAISLIATLATAILAFAGHLPGTKNRPWAVEPSLEAAAPTR